MDRPNARESRFVEEAALLRELLEEVQLSRGRFHLWVARPEDPWSHELARGGSMTASRGKTKARQNPGHRPAVARVLAELFRGYQDVRRGSMFGHPAFYASGKLFACAYGQGVGLKLPADRVESLEGQPHVSPFQPYGKPRMREWVMLSRPQSADYEKDLPLFEEAIAFVTRQTPGGHTPRKRRVP